MSKQVAIQYEYRVVDASGKFPFFTTSGHCGRETAIDEFLECNYGSYESMAKEFASDKTLIRRVYWEKAKAKGMRCSRIVVKEIEK